MAPWPLALPRPAVLLAALSIAGAPACLDFDKAGLNPDAGSDAGTIEEPCEALLCLRGTDPLPLAVTGVCSGPEGIWLGHPDGTLSHWNGSNWQTEKLPQEEGNPIHTCASTSRGLFASGSHRVHRRTSASTWVTESTRPKIAESLETAVELGTGEILFGGNGGFIIRREVDGGYAQERASYFNDSDSAYEAVWAMHSQGTATYGVGWADGGAVAFQREGPGAWVNEPLPSALRSRCLYASPNHEVWASGQEGLLLHRMNGDWAQVATSTDATLNAISATAPDDVWVVGARGTARHQDGLGWQDVALPGVRAADHFLVGVLTLSPTELYVIANIVAEGGDTPSPTFDGGVVFRYRR